MMSIIQENTFIGKTSDNYERIKKEKEYLDYINDHVLHVQKAFYLYMKPLLLKDNISKYVPDEKIKSAIEEVEVLVKTHDESKYGDDEFDGYRAKYYPTQYESHLDDEYEQKLMDQRYEECWIHHYKNNDHHPEHWYDPITKEAQDMPMTAIIHMLCDWEAMSLKFGTSTLKWYENEASKDESKKLSPNTKRIVEEFLYKILHSEG